MEDSLLKLKSTESKNAFRYGYMLKKMYLFPGTIRENILMGKPDVLEAEIMNSVKLAHLGEFPGSLPDGINTVVGELVETGSHNELIHKENGKYRYLYEMQFGETEQAVS